MNKQLLFSDGKHSNYVPLANVLVVAFVGNSVAIRFVNGEVAEYPDLVENAESQYADFLWDKNPILVLTR